MTKISVIIPIYNVDEYLEKCLDSVLSQTFKNLEVILVNDGSLDNSLLICRKYENIDNRVKVFDIPNSGVSAARNLGLRNASGNYITFVDPDDWIESDMYNAMYNKIISDNYDICMCGISNVVDGRIVYKDYLASKDCLYTKESILNELLPNLIGPQTLKIGERTIMGSVCRLLIKREIIFKNNLIFKEDLHLSEDYLFCIHLFLNSNKVYLLKECYYFYRLVDSSAVHKYREKFFQIQKEVYSNTEKILFEHNLEVKYKVRLDNLYFRLAIISIINEVNEEGIISRKIKVNNIDKVVNDKKLQSIINYQNLKERKVKYNIILLLIKLKQSRLIYSSYKFVKIIKKIHNNR